MLLTLIDVTSCENPDCREFARIVASYTVRKYYCPVCGSVSHARTVDAELASKPHAYEAYLTRVTSPDHHGVWSRS